MRESPKLLANVLVGSTGRFLVTKFLTRFDTIEYHVEDMDTPEPGTGMPSIIRQASSLEAALEGIPLAPGGRESIQTIKAEVSRLHLHNVLTGKVG